MKTNYFFMAAAAALLMISCNKEEINHASGGSDPAAGGVKSTISVTTEDLTKADFNQTEESGPYKISWQSGDKILIVQQRTTSEGEGNEFTYEGAAFNGSITTPVAGSTWHAFFPYGQFSNFSPSAHTVKAELPQNQDGSKSAFNDCYLMYKLNRSADSETPSGQEAGTALTAVELSFTLKGLTSVIKLNVPAALNLKTITLTAKDESDADVYLAGNITLQTAKGDYGMLNAGSGNIRKGNKTSVIVDAGAETFSGDVYIYLLPDNYIPSGSDRYYYSTARTLNFQFTNEDGFSCTKQVSISAEHPLKSGVLYDFGSLPSVLPFDFDFDLTMDTTDGFKLIAANGPDGIEISPASVTPSDGGFTSVTVSVPGCDSKTVGVYFRVWELKSESDFWTNAGGAGIERNTAVEGDAITFETDGLWCYAPVGSKLSDNTGYMVFYNGPVLYLSPIYNAHGTIGVRAASNKVTDTREMPVQYGATKDGETTVYTISTTGTTQTNFSIDFSSTQTTKVVSLHPGNNHRISYVYWMEWGENVTDPNPAAEAESLSGTQEYGI
ncbi:MAG: hypothetical protein J6X69_00340 [Bacteroidales bacterium]|nr:hypothetical protein [Bacteroidales bacterium]